MLRVRELSGPASAVVRDAVTYRVTAFSDAAPTPAEGDNMYGMTIAV
jgi:hypothetical protein